MIYLTALILGITSTLHCLGMCGPLVMSIPVKNRNNRNLFVGILQYNTGRIFIYFILGILIGTIGVSIKTFHFLQWVSIISGVFMVLYAWQKFFPVHLANIMQFTSLFSLISKGMGKILASENPFRLLMLGMINGLLPCGMVYLALLNALLSGNLLASGFAMILFGIGTLPALVFVAFSSAKLNPVWKTKLNRFVPVVLTFVGVLIIFRGLNLGIPYLSPKISMEKRMPVQKAKATEPSMVMTCCHKK